jgi:DNA-binding transcriptional LysR family regulator
VRLVDRTPVRLTEAGRVLAEGARPALASLEAAVHAAVAAGTAASVLRVAVPRREFARHPPVAGIVGRARAVTPGLAVEYLPALGADAEAAVAGGRADVGFVYAPVQDDGLDGLPAFPDEVLVALPRGHPLADRDVVALEDLAGGPIVTWSQRAMPGERDGVLAACRRAGFEPRFVEAPDAPGALGRMVADGVGPALVSAAWAGTRLDRGLLVRPLVRPRVFLTCMLVWRRGAPAASARPLVEALRAEA